MLKNLNETTKEFGGSEIVHESTVWSLAVALLDFGTHELPNKIIPQILDEPSTRLLKINLI